MGTTDPLPTGRTGFSKLPLTIKLAWAGETTPEARKPTASQNQASDLVREDSSQAGLWAWRVVMRGRFLVFMDLGFGLGEALSRGTNEGLVSGGEPGNHTITNDEPRLSVVFSASRELHTLHGLAHRLPAMWLARLAESGYQLIKPFCLAGITRMDRIFVEPCGCFFLRSEGRVTRVPNFFGDCRTIGDSCNSSLRGFETGSSDWHYLARVKLNFGLSDCDAPP